MNGLLNWIFPALDGAPPTTWEQAWGAGGTSMYLTMLLGMSGLMLTLAMLIHVASNGGRPTSPLPCGVLMAMGLAALGTGYVGYMSSESLVREVILNVNPDDVPSILGAGMAAAGVSLRFGILVGAPLLIAGAAFVPRRRSPEVEPVSPGAPTG